MSARIAADLGFEVGILGGSVASLQVLAAPDFALITLSEFVEQATRIGRVAQLPVIADADHGYGNALNVMRCVVELERAGVAALTIEDTLLPAQFGRKSTDLISIEEGVGKILAALEARIDPELSIIARTHAGVLEVDEVIRRTRAYEAAGADGICLVGIKDFAHLEQIAAGLKVPLMLVTYGNPELRDNQRLARLPVIADADHGYGNALNVMRTVVELERAGVAALTLEDTLLPAQFGRKSTDLIGVEEGVGKIRAALEARVDPDLAIIARTHAGVLEVDEVIRRTQAYQEAGADGICMVGVRDFEHLEVIAQNLSVPLMLVSYGNPSLRDDARLASLGVRIVVDGHAAYFAAIKATYDCLREQRGIAASDLNATELTHKYTQPEDYIVWACEYMNVKE